MEQPTSTTIEFLIPIWERVLQRSPIRVEDNFFDLGGDPSLAAKLSTEIAEKCGRELPRGAIYHAPTIAALAAVLEHPTSPRFPPLVLLKAGTDEPPVYMAYGLGSSVADLFPLANHIRSRHSIYGLQMRGIEGADEPLERVEDMAEFCLGAIRELQPRGPYCLIGYSLGGLVTLEMAQRLTEAGEKVALLAMLESYPHVHYLSLAQRIRLFMRLTKHHASMLMQLPRRQALSYILQRAKRRLHISGGRSGSGRYRPPIGVSHFPAMQRVCESDFLALARYRPRFYRGKIKFVTAEIKSDFPDDPVAVWAHLADGFEVETAPGDHLGILATHFKSLAAVLSRYLREAFSQE